MKTLTQAIRKTQAAIDRIYKEQEGLSARVKTIEGCPAGSAGRDGRDGRDGSRIVLGPARNSRLGEISLEDVQVATLTIDGAAIDVLIIRGK